MCLLLFVLQIEKLGVRNMAAGPLMCWDLFMAAHQQRMLQAESYTGVKQFADQHQWRIDWDLKNLVIAKQSVVLVTNVAQVIEFATPNLKAMNGYTPKEVVGKQPKMFQGPGTESNTRQAIREAIVRRIPFKGTITNYRKDGSIYDCYVEEYPVWNKTGELVHFIAFEKIA